MDISKKQSILIMDDDKSHLNVLAYILRQKYIIYTAKDGKTGLQIANEYVPDLILLDIIMPEMDGYEVISELKSSEITKNIPVIFITALISNNDVEKAMALGAVDYIPKPFNAANVKEKVDKQIYRFYQQKELN